MRKHIASALKARSQAIRTALDRYNLAASALSPPRPLLDWDEVVAYAFLSDFDLLRDTRQDIRTRPWATPAARLATDQWYKLRRAEEEIKRLNIEIARLQKYISDEDRVLRSKEEEIARTDRPLARQIWLYRMERGRFNDHHRKILNDIYSLPGFSGDVIRLPDDIAPAPVPEAIPLSTPVAPPPDEGEAALEDEQNDEDEDIEVLTHFHDLVDMSYDTGA